MQRVDDDRAPPSRRRRAPPRPRLVLVGKRRAATSAAKRLGYAPVVVQEPPRPEQARSAFGGGASFVEDKLRSLGDEPPAAIVAVAEGAVPAAARARAFYGLAGISPTVASRCHNKALMKRAVVESGVPCAKAIVVDEHTTAEQILDDLGLPVVLKVPVSSGGRGVHVARTRGDLLAHLRPGLLAERFVRGVEMSAETLLCEGHVLFRNHTRYLEPRWSNVVPAALDDDTTGAVDALLNRVHAALGIDHGISHVELFLTDDGPVFGEVAARPPGGHLMELIQLAYGFDPWEALLRIELGERPPLPSSAGRSAGVWVLHPGPGVVADVSGVDDVMVADGVVRVRCAVTTGDRVRPRVGSGESVGEVVVRAETTAACAARLRAAQTLVRFTME